MVRSIIFRGVILTLVVAIATLLPMFLSERNGFQDTAEAATSKRGHVYLFRGLANIFSLGMNELGDKLGAKGVRQTVVNHGYWQKLTDEIIARAEELHGAMCAAPELVTWVQLNREFHMCIYEVADHPRLVSLVRSLQDASVMAVSAKLNRLPNVREQANSEHAMLLDAIRRRDLDAAVSVILHHTTLLPR